MFKEAQMDKLTTSEALFEELCAQRNIEFERIRRDDGKTADYFAKFGEACVAVEIKQIDMNQVDKKRLAQLQNGEVVGSAAPAQRVKKAIESGYPQLKRSCNGKYPGIIVIYNNAGFINHIDAFTVSKAMYGSFAIGMQFIKDQLFLTSQRYRGGRKVTKNSLTGLSAVAVLSIDNEGRPRLVAYHNPFAKRPVAVDDFQKIAEEQYIHRNPDGAPIVSWEPARIET